jgi:protein SCO1
MRIRLISFIIAGFLIGALAGAAVLVVTMPPASQPVETSGEALVGGPFTLTGTDGKTVTDGAFRGRYMLVFFGFTHCPDICPAELQVVAQALDKLGDKASKVVPVFITVDPERDTPKVMQDYAGSFGTAIVGLSGSPQAIGATEKAYRVFSRKGPIQSDGGYSMDHSSVVYLMDKRGGFVKALNLDRPPEETAKELTGYL